MSYVHIRQAVESRFIAEFSEIPSESVLFENDERENPSSTEWCRLFVQSGEEDRIELGENPTYETLGFIVLQVFLPQQSYSKRSEEVGDALKPIFRDQRFDGITTGSLTRNPPVDDGGFYRVNYSIPFDYEA